MQKTYTRSTTEHPAAETVRELQKRRVRIILINLVYFIGLLAVALVMFFMNAGQWIYLPVAALVIFYLFVDRPMLKGFEQDLRAAILAQGTLKILDDWSYLPKEGISSSYIIKAGFINVIAENSFLSRELIRGKKGSISIEMADVTFPIHEAGLNRMFSGCLIHMTVPGADAAVLDVKAGDTSHLNTGKEKRLADKLGEFIPGSLYLHREGDQIDILMRGRFIGFQLNPLMEVHESTLNSDPLKELKTALELAGLKK